MGRPRGAKKPCGTACQASATYGVCHKLSPDSRCVSTTTTAEKGAVAGGQGL